jgi:hypothetical protein
VGPIHSSQADVTEAPDLDLAAPEVFGDSG